MPRFINNFKKLFSNSHKTITPDAPDQDRNSGVNQLEHAPRHPSIKDILKTFSNSFWKKDDMKFSSNSNLLKQFIDPDTLALSMNAAGKFDFKNPEDGQAANLLKGENAEIEEVE